MYKNKFEEFSGNNSQLYVNCRLCLKSFRILQCVMSHIFVSEPPDQLKRLININQSLVQFWGQVFRKLRMMRLYSLGFSIWGTCPQFFITTNSALLVPKCLHPHKTNDNDQSLAQILNSQFDKVYNNYPCFEFHS